MRLGKKLKHCLILFIVSSLLGPPALAQGKYVQLKAGETATFDSWCFDAEATGQIFGTIKNNVALCKLHIDEALAKQAAAFDLELGNLSLRLDSVEREYNDILLIKNKEIESLERAALKRPNDYNHWWAIGGFSVGILTVISISYLLNGSASL